MENKTIEIIKNELKFYEDKQHEIGQTLAVYLKSNEKKSLIKIAENNLLKTAVAIETLQNLIKQLPEEQNNQEATAVFKEV